MTQPDPSPAPPRRTLARRLQESRRRAFVGRREECRLFLDAVQAAPLPFVWLHLCGPGGVGKSALLGEYRRLAGEIGIPAWLLDAREIECTPEGMDGALRRALHLEPGADPLAALPERPVLLIDAFERLGALEHWLREDFLPALPEGTLVVTAARHPLGVAWTLDPDWFSLIRQLPLRNLRPDESAELLAQRGVPPPRQAGVLAYTLGHPLALSLMAEVQAQGDLRTLQLGAHPDIIRTLLERFLDEVPRPDQRGALELCGLARVTDESLLGAVFGPEQAPELFAWLSHLSFIEALPGGVAPHDLAREALVAELRWRNREWYAELHRRAREYYAGRLGRTSGAEQLGVLYDDVFLHRENPLVRPFLDWQELGSLYVDAARPADEAAFLDSLAALAGPDSVLRAGFWLARQPGGLLVVRDARPEPAGFLFALRLDQAAEADLHLDPATRGAVAAMRHRAPLRPGDRALYYRFWLARDTHQGVSAAQSLLFVRAVQGYLALEKLAWSFFPVADPAFWHPALAYMDLAPLPEAEYSGGPHRFTVYAHDWRVTPPAAWLTLLGERELATSLQLPQAPTLQRPLLVLSEPDFAAAVRSALRHHTRESALADSPLLRSRLLGEWEDAPATAATLRRVLQRACDTLKTSPRDLKLYRALHHTFLDPAPTQEIAAERLDLPFSTYRRHLSGGLEQVTALLWRWELDGPPPPA